MSRRRRNSATRPDGCQASPSGSRWRTRSTGGGGDCETRLPFVRLGPSATGAGSRDAAPVRLPSCFGERSPEVTSPLFPLRLLRCCDCGLVQLSETVPPSLLYHDRYSFKSGVSEAIVNNL